MDRERYIKDVKIKSISVDEDTGIATIEVNVVWSIPTITIDFVLKEDGIAFISNKEEF